MFTAVASVAISAEASEPEWMRGLDAALKKDGSQRTKALASLYQKLSPTESPHQFALLRLLAESDADNTTGLVPEYRRLAQMKRLLRGLPESLTVEERLACLDREWGCVAPGNESNMRRLKGQLLRNLALQQGKKPGPWMISLPPEIP